MLDSNYLLLLYNALILPFLNYCLQVWGNSYPSNLLRLVTLQKKIVRIIDHAAFLEHTSPLFKKHKILKVHDLVKISLINVMHNFLTNTLPPVLASNFSTHHLHRQRSTRVSQHFKVPFAATNYRKFSLFVAAPNAWNKVITCKIPKLEDVPRGKPFFKKVSKKIFIDEY